MSNTITEFKKVMCTNTYDETSTRDDVHVDLVVHYVKAHMSLNQWLKIEPLKFVEVANIAIVSIIRSSTETKNALFNVYNNTLLYRSFSKMLVEGLIAPPKSRNHSDMIELTNLFTEIETKTYTQLNTLHNDCFKASPITPREDMLGHVFAYVSEKAKYYRNRTVHFNESDRGPYGDLIISLLNVKAMQYIATCY